MTQPETPQQQPTFGPNSPLDLDQQIRWLVIHWSTSLTISPELVARTLQRYAKLLNGKAPGSAATVDAKMSLKGQTTKTLFRSVIDQMIEERRKQGDSHENT